MYNSYRVKVTSLWRIVYTRARETVQLLTQRTPDFIPTTQWPPNSPDLNPVDYKVWAVMQEKFTRQRLPMLMNSVIASWMRGKNLINVWLTQPFDSGVQCMSTRLCVCSGWTLWTYSVTEINLVIYFQWLVPCLLFNCKHQSFFGKSYVEQQLFSCSFQSPAFYKVWDNNS